MERTPIESTIIGRENPVTALVAAWVAAAVLGIAAVAFGQTGAGASRGLIVQSLADSGDTSTAEAAQRTLDALARKLVAAGGGLIVVDDRVPLAFKPHNRFQTARDAPGVTILDLRAGRFNIIAPPIGDDSREVWSGLRVRRTLDLEGGSLPHWGTQAAIHVENNIVQGSYSVMQFLIEPVRAGADARLYVQSIEGLAPGAYMNLHGNGGVPAGQEEFPRTRNEVVTIRSLGWDAQKRLYYVTADVKYDHPAGTILQNKHTTPGMAVHNHSNADNQTFWLDARAFQYGVGDQFVVSATHTYQSNVFSGLGDEGAVCLNAETIHDLDPFRGEVESFDPATGRLVYKPGKTRSEKLALSRPLVNLNPAKWITQGRVLIVRRGGRFQGKDYPDHTARLGQETIHVRGGLIIGTRDAPWDESVVGRYFAIDEDSEKYNPGELPGGYWPFPDDGHPIRRWYRITDFRRHDDGTKSIRILRTAWYAMSAGAPDLFREDNYTWDGHERPLKYIIAPGGELSEIRQGWVDTRRPGVTPLSLPSDPRTLIVVPNADRGRRMDFAPGDPIEQAVGPDPWMPRPLRVRMFDEFPPCMENPAIEIVNNGRIARQSGISFHGGPRDLKDLAQRKDQQPPYVTGITFHSAVGCGVRFRGQVRDAALMMEQREGNPQPLAWRHARGTTYVGADPASGNLTVRGGALDLDRPAITRGGLAEVRGLSATRTAAKNLRGIDVPVPPGRTSIDVAFTEHEPDARYALCVQPNWLTAAAVAEKRMDGFRVLFAEAAPKGATIDWQLIR